MSRTVLMPLRVALRAGRSSAFTRRILIGRRRAVNPVVSVHESPLRSSSRRGRIGGRDGLQPAPGLFLCLFGDANVDLAEGFAVLEAGGVVGARAHDGAEGQDAAVGADL